MPARLLAPAAVGALVVAAVSWQASSGSGTRPADAPPGIVAPSAIALASYNSCGALLRGLRARTVQHVGPYGLPGMPSYYALDAVRAAAPAPQSATGAESGSAAQSAPHSDTNVQEAGVDEPDLVKTDGRRIVTVAGDVLRVVDAATRTVTGTLRLGEGAGRGRQLLLSGDRALMLTDGGYAGPLPGGGYAGPLPSGGAAAETSSSYVLVDLSAAPKVIGSVHPRGAYLDARMVGSTVRLVVRSQPEIALPGAARPSGSDAERTARNRAAIAKAPLTAWLPDYRVVVDGTAVTRTVPCTSVSHPVDFTGASMLTIYTIDLARGLDDLEPISIAADGDTVYGTADSLYVASNPRWWGGCCIAYDVAAPEVLPATGVAVPPAPMPKPVPETTQIHRFALSGDARPTYVGSGEVAGRLLDSYSLSDYDGHLRVAVTTMNAAGVTGNAVAVLDADTLAVTGRVGGLGRGERIYAVRFAGPLGYVVTFRETDPLYVLDLRDPAAPRVTGELRITGYSTYLHPVGDGRLLGIGQEASRQGRVAGMQVSLFDVSDPAAPQRIARVHRPGDVGEARTDPHAFLYWAPTGTVVVPVDAWSGPDVGKVVVLNVTSAALTTRGLVGHPSSGTDPEGVYAAAIERSLVVGDSLWTVSEAGLQADDLATLQRQAWLPFR